jgi:hypothetical protein
MQRKSEKGQEDKQNYIKNENKHSNSKRIIKYKNIRKYQRRRRQ